MTESLESLPLPDHPLLATWASALNDAGYWATLMDAEWRIVFVTDETLLTYRDMGAATPPPIGAHFLSVEWREYMQTVLGASGSSEDLRASFLDTGRFVLAGTPGGREQLRRVLEPQLASFVDQLQPEELPDVWMNRQRFKTAGAEAAARTVWLRIDDPDGQRVGVCHLGQAPGRGCRTLPERPRPRT
jgi:hypothetical protein